MRGLASAPATGQIAAMTAILFAFASAAFIGSGVALTQFGLRTVHPLTGAAISIPSFTLCFVLMSPWLLRGETVVWTAVPIFAAVGLVYPAAVTISTFASSRALGPVVTSALGNLAPLFSVALAVLLLHEPLRLLQFAGLLVAVAGVVIITVTRTPHMQDWRTLALLLPLAAALMRGIVPPVIKIGLEVWPSPIGAGLVAYIVSSLTVMTLERIRNGHFIARVPMSGRLWFAATGICNGIGTLFLYAAVGAGRVAVVAPLIATYPLVTLAVSAIVLTSVTITPRLVAGVVLAVSGVVLILAG
jgi:drug/metabolite transporter (DMT)-like permease